eukprot:3245781-Alexandrium_andersonii.AAC.1
MERWPRPPLRQRTPRPRRNATGRRRQSARRQSSRDTCRPCGRGRQRRKAGRRCGGCLSPADRPRL